MNVIGRFQALKIKSHLMLMTHLTPIGKFRNALDVFLDKLTIRVELLRLVDWIENTKPRLSVAPR